ncbi:MAG: alpha/beta hydrolase [Propionibacteriaceae bacterium]|jgi:acetyl esterase/lipase|nr:alpha/beta hydrolase [Propionibacteriaceae bacterium]
MSRLVRHLVLAQWQKNARDDAARKAAQSPPAGVAAERDLPYRDDGHPLHSLDVFYPEGTAGLLPVIVDIHGGGWVYGDKALNEYFCMSLAARGFCVVDPGYRLLPEADLKAQLQDVMAVLEWTGQHAGEHHGDVTRVAVTGDSAGAHLASLAVAVGLNPELCELYGVAPPGCPVHAVVLNHGAADLHARIAPRVFQREYEQMLFGRQPAASPLYRHSGLVETADPATYPPVLVLTSPADGLYPLSQALVDHLHWRGFTYEVALPNVTAPGAARLGHVFNVLYPQWPESMAINDRLTAFIRRHLPVDNRVCHPGDSRDL